MNSNSSQTRDQVYVASFDYFICEFLFPEIPICDETHLLGVWETGEWSARSTNYRYSTLHLYVTMLGGGRATLRRGARLAARSI